MHGWNHRHWIGQILRNLANAIDPPAKGTITVTVTHGTHVWTTTSGTSRPTGN